MWPALLQLYSSSHVVPVFASVTFMRAGRPRERRCAMAPTRVLFFFVPPGICWGCSPSHELSIFNSAKYKSDISTFYWQTLS
jgi:hypothetical protein